MAKLKVKEVLKKLVEGNPKIKPSKRIKAMNQASLASYEMLRKIKALKKHEEK